MVALFTDRSYEQKISIAEAAVAGMSDPQLKQVAFGKILEQLLADAAHGRSANVRGSESVESVDAPRRRAPVGRGGPIAHIEELIAEDFFRQPRSLGDVRTELANRGRHIPRTSLSGPLQALCQRKILRRMKHRVNGKEIFAYSTW